MSVIVDHDIAVSCTHPATKDFFVQHKWLIDRSEAIAIPTESLPIEALEELRQKCLDAGKSKPCRALDSVLSGRRGDFGKPVASFMAFSDVLCAYLKHAAIDGWVYLENEDGRSYPYLIHSIEGEKVRGKEENPRVVLRLCAITSEDWKETGAVEVRKSVVIFAPQDVARKRIQDILAASGVLHETQELKDAYQAELERHQELCEAGFPKQFRFNGLVRAFCKGNYWGRAARLEKRKVIFDSDQNDFLRTVHFSETEFGEDAGVVPLHCVARVFDLKSHDFYWVNTAYLEQYQYDKSLADKLILPDTHRDLLDVLTTDLDAFVGDIIEGKSAGNVILCRGLPGLGKTLSAEVYSELTETPLYSIHTGTLGTEASAIRKGLDRIFQMSERWKCNLLLDECDVFVGRRDGDVHKNAIVAEFLRTLEYFSGLMFMTTNRVEEIDDAIISRCAAIIGYELPDATQAAKVWNIMAAKDGYPIAAALVDSLVKAFPKISPRDIKMLLRLVLRMASKHNREPDLELFRRCAMFRAIEINAEAFAQPIKEELS